MFKGIKFKLIGYFFMLILISVLIGGFVCSLLSQYNNEKITEESKELIKDKKNDVLTFTKSKVNILNGLAKSPELEEALNGEDGKLLDLFDNILKMNPDITNIYYATLPWYTVAMENDGVSFSEVYQDIGTGDMIVTASYPIIKEGNLVGVLGIDITLDSIGELFKDDKVGSNGSLMIIDNVGNVIYSKDKKLISINLKHSSEWKDIFKDKEGMKETKEENIYYSKVDFLDWRIVSLVNKLDIQKELNSFILPVLLLSFVIFLIGVLTSYLLVNTLIRPINEIRTKEHKIRDITVVKSKDELQEVSEGFNYIVTTVRESFEEMNVVANQVKRSSLQVVSTVEETSNYMNEIDRAMGNITDNSTELTDLLNVYITKVEVLSDKLKNVLIINEKLNVDNGIMNYFSDIGKVKVDELRVGSEKTKEISDDLLEFVNVLDLSSINMERLLDKISSIAYLTNLLAINATIEAARFGEAGKGVSIVAEEIIKLSNQSSDFTKEIENLIKEIKRHSKKATVLVNDSYGIIKTQSGLVGETEQIFNGILEKASEARGKFEIINNDLVEVNKNKDYIMNSMLEVFSLSQKNEDGAKEVSVFVKEKRESMEQLINVSEDLEKVSANLKNKVSNFKIK
jgi:methyl-accepting chemotaxis protein